MNLLSLIDSGIHFTLIVVIIFSSASSSTARKRTFDDDNESSSDENERCEIIKNKHWQFPFCRGFASVMEIFNHLPMTN